MKTAPILIRLPSSGRRRWRGAESFHDLVGGPDRGLRHGEAERLCGLEVDDQLTAQDDVSQRERPPTQPAYAQAARPALGHLR
jgi:hypothetical protein